MEVYSFHVVIYHLSFLVVVVVAAAVLMVDTYFQFFFKQKTAYEIMPSLVGSEMCIRDRYQPLRRRRLRRRRQETKDGRSRHEKNKLP